MSVAIQFGVSWLFSYSCAIRVFLLMHNVFLNHPGYQAAAATVFPADECTAPTLPLVGGGRTTGLGVVAHSGPPAQPRHTAQPGPFLNTPQIQIPSGLVYPSSTFYALTVVDGTNSGGGDLRPQNKHNKG